MLKKYYRYIPTLLIAAVLAYQGASRISSNWFDLLYFFLFFMAVVIGLLWLYEKKWKDRLKK